jgi:hypothetical protein
LAPKGIYLIPGKPKPLGYIPQRFRVYGGDIANKYTPYVQRLERGMRNDIVGILKQVDPTLVNDFSGRRLGSVKDFTGIVADAQRTGVPLWKVGGPQDQLSQAKDSFRDIARKIISETARKK